MATQTLPAHLDAMEDSGDYIPAANNAEDLFRFILNGSTEYVDLESERCVHGMFLVLKCIIDINESTPVSV